MFYYDTRGLPLHQHFSNIHLPFKESWKVCSQPCRHCLYSSQRLYITQPAYYILPRTQQTSYQRSHIKHHTAHITRVITFYKHEGEGCIMITLHSTVTVTRGWLHCYKDDTGVLQGYQRGLTECYRVITGWYRCVKAVFKRFNEKNLGFLLCANYDW